MPRHQEDNYSARQATEAEARRVFNDNVVAEAEAKFDLKGLTPIYSRPSGGRNRESVDNTPAIVGFTRTDGPKEYRYDLNGNFQSGWYDAGNGWGAPTDATGKLLHAPEAPRGGGDLFSGISSGLTDIAHGIADSPVAMTAITAIASAYGVPPAVTAAALGANRAGKDGNLQAGFETGVLSYGLGEGMQSFNAPAAGVVEAAAPAAEGLSTFTGTMPYELAGATGAGSGGAGGIIASGPFAGLTGAELAAANAAASASSTAAPSIFSGLSGLSMPSLSTLGKYALGASALSSLVGDKPSVQGGPQRSASQEEYFNRPLPKWDWDKIVAEAAATGQNPNEYVAKNWHKMGAGNPYEQKPPVKLAGGGMPYAGGTVPMGGLGEVARLARGSGSGRADTIDARLSDGEYVVDAEAVAMLGDGSTQEGARRLDAMRTELRRHKGKSLSRGKISPNAKSPLAYLKEAK